MRESLEIQVVRGCPAAASFRRAGLTNTKSGVGNYREKRATFAIRSVEVKAESMFLIVRINVPREPGVFALPAAIRGWL